jgi:hypothetical protein
MDYRETKMKIKKNYILIICIGWLCSLIFAREISDSDFQDVALFENGSSDRQILYDNSKTGDFPRGVGFIFYKLGTGWVISVPQNQKLLITDDTFTIVKTLPFERESIPFMIYFDPSGWSINSAHNQALQVLNLTNMKSDFISINDSSTPFCPVYFHEHDIYLEGSQQAVFDVLRNFSKNRIIVSGEQLTQGSDMERVSSFGISFSHESIIYQGFYVSPSLKVFLQLTGWTSHKNGSDNIPFNPEVNLDGYFSGKYNDFDVHFQGNDANGNYYWVRDSVCYVFDKDGKLIRFLVTPNYNGSYERKFILTVHPSGDLYRVLMTGDNEPIRIQVLPNTWAPDAKKHWEQVKQIPTFITEISRGAFVYPFGLWKKAEINDSNVRLRQKPDLDGGIVSQLNKGTLLIVLDVTTTTTKIDNIEAPWYLVRMKNGQQGWIFGRFIDVQE